MTKLKQPIRGISTSDIARQQRVSKSQNFFQDNNAIKKEKMFVKPYTTLKIKKRN